MKSKFLLAIILLLFSARALFAAGAPVISSFSPSQGQVGTLVTIVGTNLGSPTAFSIGGTAAIVISNTGTQLVGFVMPGATTGVISLTTAGGTVSSATSFTVTAPTYPTSQQGGPLLSAEGTYYSEQGSAVALSADGNTALVGAANNGDGAGACYVFTRTAGTWTEQAQLLGAGETINYAMMGGAVALSADGNTAMAGGSLDGTTADNISGSVWFFTRTGTTWTQQGTKMQGTGASQGVVVSQGTSCSLSADGNTAIEGGPRDNSGVGAAWIFTRSSGVWTQVGSKLVGAGSGTGQGGAVALSANGSTAIVGAGSGQGGAYIYTRSGNTWTQQGNQIVVTGGSGGLGSAVAISADGNTILMGAPGANGAWAFGRTGGIWSQLGAEFTFPNASPYVGAEIGSSVGLSADGYTAIVGGAGNGNGEGGTWIFTRSGSTFTNQGGLIVASGNAVTGGGNEGSGVALSATGTTGISGAPGNNTSTGYAFVLAAVVPSVVTNAATNVAATTANINGYVSTGSFSATANFQWGTDPNLVGATTTTTFAQGTNPVGPNSSEVYFDSALSGLTPSTTYYFRMNATNINGTGSGAILNFTTPAAPPVPVVITFIPPGYVIYGSTTTPVISSTDKVSPINYRIGNTAVATVTANGQFQATGVGTTFILAYQYAPGTTNIEATASQNITVLPAPLTITANDQTLVWGQPAAAFTYTYSGFVNDDTQANLPPSALPTATSPYSAGSPAGSYFIFNGPTGNGSGGNYNITYVNGTIKVTALYGQPTATTEPATAITATGATINGLVNPGGASTTVVLQYTTDDDDGLGNLVTATLTTGPGTLSGSAGNTNYAAILTGLQPGTTYYFIITGSNPEFSVTGNTLTFTTPAGGLSFQPLAAVTYGSADVTPTATSTNTTIPITYASSNTSVATITADGNIHPISAGTSTITASQTGSGFSPVMETFTVNPAPLTVAASNQTSVYGANIAALAFTYAGFVNGDTPASLTTPPTVSTPANSSSPVGGYTVTASGAVDPNYSITYVAGNYTITPAPLTIAANNQTVVSGAAFPELTVTYNGFVNEDNQDNLTTPPSVTTAASPASSPGQYPITVSGAADANYTITYVSGTLTITQALVFNPLPPKTYGSPDFNAGATGTDVTYSSANTSVATISESGEIHIVAAGSVVITASAGGASIQQTLIINPAPLTVIANNQTSVYGSNIAELAVTYSGFVNGDTPASLTTQATVSTIANSSSPVGAYPTVASGVSDPNYTITYTAGNYTITPAPLTITANNQTIAFNAAIPALTIIYNGFVNEDSQDNLTTQPSVVTTATATSMAGTYPITVSGAADANYTITYVAGTLTINPLLVFGPLPVKTYGDPDFNPGATGPDVTYTSANTGIATITEGGDIHIVGAGTSVITASSGGASAQQTLTVNKAPLTVTADNQTSVYGSAIPVLTVSYATFVNGDTESSLTTPATAATVATTTSNVGTYPITASGAVSSNYSFTYVPGTLTITKATQTITFAPIPTQIVSAPYDSVYNPISNYTKVADPASSAYDLSGVTASSGLPISFSISDPSLASIRGNSLVSLALGTVTITATQDGNENYLAAAPVSQTFNIEYADGGDVIVSMVVSPNGDGINDILKIINIEQYPDNNMILINRNGVKIFEISGYNNTTRVFDGHSSITGELQQQGTYLYMLRYHDADGVVKVKKGFTELRY